jgi:hypothetical protein
MTAPCIHARALATLVAGTAALAGCTSNGVQVDASTRSVAFVDEFDGKALLEAQPTAVAVLPALAPNQQGLGPVTGMTLQRAIERIDPKARVQGGGIVMGRLNAAGLGETWRDLASGYVMSGVLERSELAKVAQAAGARYLLMPMLATMNTKTDTRLTFLGLVVGRTSSTTVDVSLQLWDSATGKIAWASTGWCAIEAEVVLATRASLSRALESVWTQMLIDLVQGRSRSVLNIEETARTGDDDGVPAGDDGNAAATDALNQASPDHLPSPSS